VSLIGQRLGALASVDLGRIAGQTFYCGGLACMKGLVTGVSVRTRRAQPTLDERRGRWLEALGAERSPGSHR